MGYSGPGCGILNLQVTERSVNFANNENKNILKENVLHFMCYTRNYNHQKVDLFHE